MPLAGSLGNLKKSAALTRTEEFEPWYRAADVYLAPFYGRLYPFDVFKTIYHRPTRRESLSIADPDVLPESHVVRHSASGDLFAVSTTGRFNVERATTYDRLFALHRVSRGNLTRYAVAGTGDDLGPLVADNLGAWYADLELRTEEAFPETHREQFGAFFLTSPYDSIYTLQDRDIVTLNGTSYQIREVYDDSGFQLARAEARPVDWETLTYKMPSSAPSGSYDSVTGAVTSPTTLDRLFSGTVTDNETQLEGQTAGDDITIHVDVGDVGFTFLVGSNLLRGTDNLEIYNVSIGPDKKQWIVKARRTP